MLTPSRAGCMVRCKMTQGRAVTEVPCLLDIIISLRLSLAMSEQSLKKMGFSWASWTSRMAKSIVVRFFVRKGNLMKNMEERLMASGHPVSWWAVHPYLTNVTVVKARAAESTKFQRLRLRLRLRLIRDSEVPPRKGSSSHQRL